MRMVWKDIGSIPPYGKRVILRRNVVFDENSMFNPIMKFTIPEDYGIEKYLDVELYS